MLLGLIMKKFFLVFFVIIAVILFIQNSTKSEESIKIGFVAGLSGKYSSLGNDVKNGILLAFEEINYKINDIKIDIIQKDDKQNSQEAKKVIDELINGDIKVIIGNTTSSMTKISVNALKEKKDILLISSTASSDEFSFKDDNFIRTQVSNNYMKFNSISKYILDKRYKNIVAIYDPNNLSYSNAYLNNFEKSFLHNGGNEFIDKIAITDDYESIKNQILLKKVDSIIIVANSLDAAKLIQYLRINDINQPILCSGWAKTLDFLVEGGASVENVLFHTGYDDNSTNKEYLKFIKLYEERYNKKPSVFSAQAYETAAILIQTLKDDKNVLNLKRNILNKKSYMGLQGDITFNKYGDVNRDYFMMHVKNGKYTRIERNE